MLNGESLNRGRGKFFCRSSVKIKARTMFGVICRNGLGGGSRNCENICRKTWRALEISCGFAKQQFFFDQSKLFFI